MRSSTKKKLPAGDIGTGALDGVALQACNPALESQGPKIRDSRLSSATQQVWGQPGVQAEREREKKGRERERRKEEERAFTITYRIVISSVEEHSRKKQKPVHHSSESY